jgi:hypothetical protein
MDINDLFTLIETHFATFISTNKLTFTNNAQDNTKTFFVGKGMLQPQYSENESGSYMYMDNQSIANVIIIRPDTRTYDNNLIKGYQLENEVRDLWHSIIEKRYKSVTIYNTRIDYIYSEIDTEGNIIITSSINLFINK